MTAKLHRIQITNPCQQKWAGMEISPGGRFCSSCKKEVTDFTGFSNTELINYFVANKITEGCGKFLRSQTDTIKIPIDIQIFQKTTAQWKKFLILLLCCFGREVFNTEVVFGQTIANDSTRIVVRADSTPVSENIAAEDSTAKEEINLAEVCPEPDRVELFIDTAMEFSFKPVTLTIEIGDIVLGGFGIFPETEIDISILEKRDDTRSRLIKDAQKLKIQKSTDKDAAALHSAPSLPDKTPQRKENENHIPVQAVLADNDPMKKFRK